MSIVQPPSGQPQPLPEDWYFAECDACGHYRKYHTATVGDCNQLTVNGLCTCLGFIEQGQPQQEPANEDFVLGENVTEYAGKPSGYTVVQLRIPTEVFMRFAETDDKVLPLMVEVLSNWQQQEPAPCRHEWEYSNIVHDFGRFGIHYRSCRKCDARQASDHETGAWPPQERQAGGHHVHERTLATRNPDYSRCECGYVNSEKWWQGWEARGVADAAAREGR